MRGWWIGVLGWVFAASAAFAQEPGLHKSDAIPGAHFRTAGGANLRVVEVTEDGAWVEVEPKAGMTHVLQGETPSGRAQRRFVRFARPSLDAPVAHAVEVLASSEDPQEVKDAKAVVGKLVRDLRAGARNGTAAARETLGKLEGALRTALNGASRRTPAHRALEEVETLQAQARSGAAPQNGVENQTPDVEAARKGLVALAQRGRAALEDGVSLEETLRAYVAMEVEVSRLLTGIDFKARSAFNQELAELSLIERSLYDAARTRLAPRVEDDPVRALYDLAQVSVTLAPRSDRTAGGIWGLMQDTRRSFDSELLDLDTRDLDELERGIGKLEGVGRIYRDAIAEAGVPYHPLQKDVERVGEAIERYTRALEEGRARELERVNRMGAGGYPN
ncbi:MAG: hypothetical protein R3F62_23490 [Planctomycetota bacterium]